MSGQVMKAPTSPDQQQQPELSVWYACKWSPLDSSLKQIPKWPINKFNVTLVTPLDKLKFIPSDAQKTLSENGAIQCLMGAIKWSISQNAQLNLILVVGVSTVHILVTTHPKWDSLLGSSIHRSGKFMIHVARASINIHFNINKCYFIHSLAYSESYCPGPFLLECLRRPNHRVDWIQAQAHQCCFDRTTTWTTYKNSTLFHYFIVLSIN